MIITIASLVPGVGKTAVAFQLALYLRVEKKHKVLLVDGSKNENALTAVSIRADSCAEPSLACSAYSNAGTLVTQIDAQREVWDDIVIDMGGLGAVALSAVLRRTDVLAIPVHPRNLDVWALRQVMNVIDDARMKGGEFNAVTFLANASSNAADNRATCEQLKMVDQLEFIDAPLEQNESFTKACLLGRCVTEDKPKDKKAIDELKALVEALYRVGGKPKRTQGMGEAMVAA